MTAGDAACAGDESLGWPTPRDFDVREGWVILLSVMPYLAVRSSPLRSRPPPDSSIPCIFPQAIQTFALTTFS
jgi:hypothetical protein